MGIMGAHEQLKGENNGLQVSNMAEITNMYQTIFFFTLTLLQNMFNE